MCHNHLNVNEPEAFTVQKCNNSCAQYHYKNTKYLHYITYWVAKKMFTFASVFGRTTPIEPGTTSWLSGIDITDKVVSVIPYPNTTEKYNFLSCIIYSTFIVHFSAKIYSTFSTVAERAADNHD